MTFIRLVRMPNLVIVALTQYLLNYQIIQKAFQQQGISPVLDASHFSIFILVTVLVTAGGYIINDITDFKADLVNKPEKVVINKKVSVQTAFWLYFFLNLLGFVLSLFLAYHVKKVYLANLYPLAAMGLYAYSLRLKKRPLWGNLLVAAYCGGVAALIWLAEWDGFLVLKQNTPDLAAKIAQYLVFYISFAFLTTFFREVIKDLEDLEGDRRAGCRTLPIIWGEAKTKRFAIILGGFTMLLLILFLFLLKGVSGVFFSLLIAIILVLGYILFLLRKPTNKASFKKISLLTKLVMLGGVLLLFLIKI